MYIRLLFFLLLSVTLAATDSLAQGITVNPTGVNVRHTGPTSVFLTFRGLESSDQPAEGLWCGAINADGSCVANQIYGRLPIRNDLSRRSGTGNFTDIMTIPSSVARRAYQSARSGGPGVFFYVRRFVSESGSSTFVPVTCRPAGGGARSPLALVEVRVQFKDDDRAVPSIKRGQYLPEFGAEIKYNGAGRLKGRWEVVLPGDEQPTRTDLLPEGSLPPEERVLQRRYTLIGRFERFLPPTGRAYIPGPDPKMLPQRINGLHRVLFRVEATAASEARSDTGSGVVASGGLAGFPMPTLRYYVGSAESIDSREARIVFLTNPKSNQSVSHDEQIRFNWQRVAGATHYQLIVESDEERVFSAFLKGSQSEYLSPPWAFKEMSAEKFRWKVFASDASGSLVAESPYRSFTLNKSE